MTLTVSVDLCIAVGFTLIAAGFVLSFVLQGYAKKRGDARSMNDWRRQAELFLEDETSRIWPPHHSTEDARDEMAAQMEAQR